DDVVRGENCRLDVEFVVVSRRCRRRRRTTGKHQKNERDASFHAGEYSVAAMPQNTFNTLDTFDLGNGRKGQYFSLRKLEQAGIGPVSTLPISIRIVLESVLRNVDGKKITEDDVRTLANWKAKGEREDEIPFMV